MGSIKEQLERIKQEKDSQRVDQLENAIVDYLEPISHEDWTTEDQMLLDELLKGE